MDTLQTQSTITWQGFHHIALISADLDATVSFYRDALGMQPAKIIPGRGTRGRHVMVKPGDTTSWGLHFFEHTDAQLAEQHETLNQLFTKTRTQFTFLAGALQHIAFALPDEAAALQLRQQLEAHHVVMTPINEVSTIRNFLFLDNNGILLEAAWPKI